LRFPQRNFLFDITMKACGNMTGDGKKARQMSPGSGRIGASAMQIKIRQPMTVDVTAAGDKSSFTIHFITKGKHEAAVTVPAEMLTDLTSKLQAVSGEPVPENPTEDDRRNLLLRALSGGAPRAA
jgi:hypothetical protein